MNLLQHRQGGEVIENEKSFDKYFFSNTYFFSFTNNVQANFFTDDKEDNKSEIEEIIDKDEGGLFEKIIAKMIRRYSRNSF